MTTVRTAIQQTLRKLRGTRYEDMNRLDGSIPLSTDDVDVTLEFEPDGWDRGTIIEMGLELLSCLFVDQPNHAVKLERGFGGTPVQAHVSQRIRVSPDVPSADVFDALLAELRSLNGTGLHRYTTTKLGFQAGTLTYDLGVDPDTAVDGVYGVRWEDTGGKGAVHPSKFRFLRDVDTDVFPSGYAVMVLEGGSSGQPLSVTYAQPFDDFESESDDIEEKTGLPPYAMDLLLVGAAARLAPAGEGMRVQVDMRPARTEEEVPATANARWAQFLAEMRERELARALAQQLRHYPIRMRA